MTIRFTVLASGSAGNASLVQVDGFGLLLDAGLGPRSLARRLEEAGLSWGHVRAVLLTHTHSDHWNGRTLAHLSRQNIQLYCHEDHQSPLQSDSAEFVELRDNQLVHAYRVGEVLALAPGLQAEAIPLRHEGRTFGFRLETLDRFGRSCALAYAADLGSWTPRLARALANADILALEFNHDVDLQVISGRPRSLIRRNLSDHGHLSNVQAADLLREVLRLSRPGRLRHLVQLHLSRDCNRPHLAVEAARAASAGHDLVIHTSAQDAPLPCICTGPQLGGSASRRRSRARPLPACVAWLPGLEP
jgi:phosphoribosyl 1,2-cyclic phosphodiesterase